MKRFRGGRLMSAATSKAITGFTHDRNRGTARICGPSGFIPTIGTACLACVDGAEDAAAHRSNIAGNAPTAPTNISSIRPSFCKDAEGRPVEFAGTLTDITEQRSLESQLVQAQKMDAIGKLTGGIAHDFNNLLAAVIGGLGLLDKRAELDDEQRRILAMTKRAAEQGSELVRRLLAFARRQKLEPQRDRPSEAAGGRLRPPHPHAWRADQHRMACRRWHVERVCGSSAAGARAGQSHH